MQAVLAYVESIPNAYAIPVLFVLRILSVIVPPVQGWPIDALLLLKLSWWNALLVSMAGIMTGSTIAFYLSKRILRSLLSQSKLTRIDQVAQQYPQLHSFWGLLTLRLFTNPIYDIICYAAGFSRIRFTHYFFASLLGILPLAVVKFYVGEAVLVGETRLLLAVAVCLVLLWILWRFLLKGPRRLNEGG